jgi:hypothetical protein
MLNDELEMNLREAVVAYLGRSGSLWRNEENHEKVCIDSRCIDADRRNSEYKPRASLLPQSAGQRQEWQL